MPPPPSPPFPIVTNTPAAINAALIEDSSADPIDFAQLTPFSRACSPSGTLFGTGAIPAFSGMWCVVPPTVSKLNFDIWSGMNYITFWIKFGGASSWPALVSRGFGFTPDEDWLVASGLASSPAISANPALAPGENVLYYGTDGEAATYTAQAGVTGGGGDWHHVAFSFDGSSNTLTIGIDGALFTSYSVAPPAYDPTKSVQLLYSAWGGETLAAELRIVRNASSLPYAQPYAVPTARVDDDGAGGTVVLDLRCGPPPAPPPPPPSPPAPPRPPKPPRARAVGRRRLRAVVGGEMPSDAAEQGTSQTRLAKRLQDEWLATTAPAGADSQPEGVVIGEVVASGAPNLMNEQPRLSPSSSSAASSSSSSSSSTSSGRRLMLRHRDAMDRLEAAADAAAAARARESEAAGLSSGPDFSLHPGGVDPARDDGASDATRNADVGPPRRHGEHIHGHARAHGRRMLRHREF